MRRRLRSWIVLAAFAAGCVSLENGLVYQPTPSPADAALPPPGSGVRDLELRSADGTRIHARWCPHPGARGAVLFCHGNAGNLDGRARPVRELWEATGESVLIFDYPGYGRSGGVPGEAGCYAAADAAYDWLTTEGGVPPERVVVYGESLGGGVAVDLASRKPHRALVLVRTFTSLPDLVGDKLPLFPARWVMSNRFDSAAKIGRCGGPVLIAQADADRLMPFAHGGRLRDAAGPGARLFRLEGLDHNDPLPPAFYEELRRFLGDAALRRG